MTERVQLFLWKLFGTGIAVAIVVGIMVFAFLCGVDSFSEARATSLNNQCVGNLAFISSFKQAWSETNDAAEGGAVPASAFFEYAMHSGRALLHPHGTNSSFDAVYRLNPIGAPPECLVDSTHRLSPGRIGTR